MKIKFFSVLFFLLFVLSLASGRAQAATITPNITADAFNDPNNCSLRDAVESVNTAPAFSGGCANFSTGTLGSNDVIQLGAGTYTLSIDSDNDGMNDNGDIDIFKTGRHPGGGGGFNQRHRGISQR